MDDPTKFRYGVLLVRDIFISFVLYLKFFNNFIRGGDGEFESCTAPMVDLGTNEFKNKR